MHDDMSHHAGSGFMHDTDAVSRHAGGSFMHDDVSSHATSQFTCGRFPLTTAQQPAFIWATLVLEAVHCQMERGKVGEPSLGRLLWLRRHSAALGKAGWPEGTGGVPRALGPPFFCSGALGILLLTL